MTTQLDADEVLAVLKDESARHRKNNFIFQALCWAILLFMVGATLTGHIEWSSLLTLVGLGGAGLAASGKHKMAATVAAQLQEPRALPFLVEFLASEDKSMRAVASMAVLKILNTVDEPTFRSLAPHQRDDLAKALNATKDLDLAAAILGAASRVGGTEWIRPLEHLAGGHSPMRTRDRERAESLAKMALADIRMRAAKQKIDATMGDTPLDQYTSQVLGVDPEEETHLKNAQ